MFKTKIDSNTVGVVFQHQRAAHIGQLTRPEVWKGRNGMEVKRVAVYAVTYCFFNEVCAGVAFCAYADRAKYSREVGRRLALKNALAMVLKRSGRKDDVVAEERAQVWEDYFRSGTHRNQCNPLVLGRTIHRMAMELKGAEFITEPPCPIDFEPLNIPWKLSQPMTDDVIDYLNDLDAKEKE